MTPAQFNKQYPVGTEVMYRPPRGKGHKLTRTKTRAKAFQDEDGHYRVAIVGRCYEVLLSSITVQGADSDSAEPCQAQVRLLPYAV